MANITLGGAPFTTSGNLPQLGAQAPDFVLVKSDLGTASLSDYKGKKVVLNIFPSVDTGTCAASVRKFNEEAAALENTKVLCVSRDLPFALNRFCGVEKIENVKALSDFRNGAFGEAYGVTITDGPLTSLLARAIVVLDEEGVIKYTELVSELKNEPNYDAALAAL